MQRVESKNILGQQSSAGGLSLNGRYFGAKVKKQVYPRGLEDFLPLFLMLCRGNTVHDMITAPQSSFVTDRFVADSLSVLSSVIRRPSEYTRPLFHGTMLG